MAQNINAIKGTPKAKGEDVLVTEMHFGEQVTASGIIIAMMMDKLEESILVGPRCILKDH